MRGNPAEKEFIKIVKEIILDTIGGVDSPILSGELRENNIHIYSDILLEKNDNLLVVEVKLFTYSRPSARDIENAAAQLVKIAKTKNNAKIFGLLVTSYFVNRSIKEKIENDYGIKVWDRNTLFTLAKESINLHRDLERIIFSIYPNYDKVIYEYINEKDIEVEKDVFKSEIISSKKTSSEADVLIERIDSISAGRKNGDDKKFENWCLAVINYLFKDQLDEIKDQEKSESLFRYDAIARLLRKNEFWDELYQDFRSKFVIFEFKNYTDPITQKEIYTTERYLFPKALRSIAFIITRKGEDQNAKLVRNGALRQEGKLILVFSEHEIIDLIKLKRDGDDPNLVIQEKIDKMLISIER